MAMATQTGRMEIVVDEKGAVTAVSMVKSIFPAYDSLLASAAKEWRYKPATREGRPVRYRLLLEIVLRPQQP